MPQKLQQGYTLQYSPKVLLTRPAHAARIGLIAAEWAALEDQLAFGYSFGLFTFSKTEHGAREVARTTLNAIDSLAARLQIISSVIESRIPADLYQEYEGTVVREVRKRARERNLVVHGHWQVADKYPDDIILTRDGEEPLRYSVKDLDDIADRINGTLNQVATFWIHVQQRLYPDGLPQLFNPQVL